MHSLPVTAIMNSGPPGTARGDNLTATHCQPPGFKQNGVGLSRRERCVLAFSAISFHATRRHLVYGPSVLGALAGMYGLISAGLVPRLLTLRRALVTKVNAFCQVLDQKTCRWFQKGVHGET